MNKLKIAWLFPDILYLHGERGNILALERGAKLAGLETSVEKIDFDTNEFNPNEYDIIFCPPGEIASFPTLIQWLMPYKDSLADFVDKGRILIATGTGQCIFGKKITRESGEIIEGLEITDCDFKERSAVYGDDLNFTTNYGDEEMECFGSQIQMMDVISSEEPFGRLIYGFGNTGKDRNEGIIKNNSIFTNTLGPILVLNPWLTKKIVIQCMKNNGIEIKEFDFDMSLELKSLETKKEFTSSKVTKLTNCK